MQTLVWAYKPLEELQGQTGFVACEQQLAKQLIDAGDVQDPAVGAIYFKEIQTAQYSTKGMTGAINAEPKPSKKPCSKK